MEKFQSKISNNIYSYEPFGYEGQVTKVEVDLSNGIQGVDIIGIADSNVKETRRNLIAATKNAGLEFPEGRVLISVLPEDFKKNSQNADFAMALSLQNALNQTSKDKILAAGELDSLNFSSNIMPVRAIRAAVIEALKQGITKIICHPVNKREIKDIEGVSVYAAETLEQASLALSKPELFIKNKPSKNIGNPNDSVEFAPEPLVNIDEKYLTGHSKTVEAIEAAVAGKHNLLLEGSPGSGKTLIAQKLIPYLTPRLTNEEAQTPARIKSIAGLSSYKNPVDKNTPFRMPHQTASIEGMLGGGVNLRPGEVSLSHNGTLFLDEAQEFKSSVILMLKPMMKLKKIAMSRAERSSVFPANFQLVMSANPCSCGNLGCPGKICLDSQKSVETYKKKLEPLTERTEITSYVYKDPTDHKKINLTAVRERIRTAYEIQRKHGKYNKDLDAMDLKERIDFTPEMNTLLGKTFPVYVNQSEYSHDNSVRDLKVLNTMRLSLTVANLDGREKVTIKDLHKAIELGQSIESKSRKLCRKIAKEQKKEITRESR
ncbi:ATP-binding protein [Treponema pectinovorum]|uniref:ATP-binding protein n=1 Tax=Treponema pectinovorum TaxID=164 RepID=UPI0011F3E1B7|nr:ATP-binding protein [Treponema pectinovorum]